LRKTKELRRFHAILADVGDHSELYGNVLMLLQLKMPAKLGRLPNLIGEPAGGSLTADQWLNFATVVAPLAVSSCYGEVHQL
jgi:hypothetical protein